MGPEDMSFEVKDPNLSDSLDMEEEGEAEMEEEEQIYSRKRLDEKP